MTRRCAVLLVERGVDSGAAPPGMTPADLGSAMICDVAEVLHELSGVDSLVICRPEHETAIRKLLWADMPLVTAAVVDVRAGLQLAEAHGYAEAAVVVADVPDLPQMILAKMFQALAMFPVAVAPAAGGAAVALGVALPAPGWLTTSLAQAGLDSPQLITNVRASAPRPSNVKITPGWHRLRRPEDLHRLDPGLEGWEATRSVLAGVRAPGEG